ncbi:MAG: hypothetical protein U0794_04600 [Isosphaeraceae bacterium]
MSDAAATADPNSTPSTGAAGLRAVDSKSFDALDETLRNQGASQALDRLLQELEGRHEFRALLDALLLKARYELGLPLLHTGSLNEVAEPARSQYEERYVAAIRHVGRKFLDQGDPLSAWPYFRAIGEPEPVARALEEYRPTENDPNLGAIIEVAFNQGANPRRGYELILEHYGSCSAITAFEQLPRDDATRAAAAGALVRQLHAHLTANLRSDIEQRGQETLAEGLSILDLVSGRDWLFADEAYHIDVSHLASTVRVAPLLSDPEVIATAVDLTEYGRRLSPRHIYEGDPPFENVYEDHRTYLRALLGQDVDEAIQHFRTKLTPSPDPYADEDEPQRPDPTPAQVLVGLLNRIGHVEEAIDVAAEHLAGYPESALFCPGVSQLCERARRPDRLAAISRAQGDLVHYAAARLDELRSRSQPPATT